MNKYETVQFQNGQYGVRVEIRDRTFTGIIGEKLDPVFVKYEYLDFWSGASHDRDYREFEGSCMTHDISDCHNLLQTKIEDEEYAKLLVEDIGVVVEE